MSDPTNPNGGWQDVPNTPVDPAASNVPPGGYPPASYPPQQAPLSAPGLSMTAAAAISYITFIPAVVFLVLDPYKRDPFVRFHAIQSLALWVLWVVVWLILGVIFTPLLVVGMWGTIHLISQLVRLAFFLVALFGIIQASQGKWFKIPVLGDFALKQSQK